MKIFYSICFFLLVSLSPFYACGFQNVIKQDSSEVNRLNAMAYKIRQSDAEQTVSIATQALNLAKRINYTSGVAEAYRTIGIGYSYQYESVKAFENYQNALTQFISISNTLGEAKVYNNIGNLYRDNDYDVALIWFKKADNLVAKINEPTLKASIYLNEGNVYLRKKNFYNALFLFDKARVMFEKLGDKQNLISAQQNTGVAHFRLRNFDEAKKLLMEAHDSALEMDMSASIASIDLTLASLFISESKFDQAEHYIEEGTSFAHNKKIESDYQYTHYELEYKRRNFEKALFYLTTIYRQDSTDYKGFVSDKIAMLETKYKQEAQLSQNQITIERQKNTRYKFLGATIVSGLLMVVIVLLFASVKRKQETNRRLTELNDEVSKQKDDLDRINHHLEEIIDERTKDLQIKNKKLSEYSSYLSHQIRGPIATLKGLMNLEKEGLVDKNECIVMMDKCVSEIDEKIIDMSDMLHDPGRTGFNNGNS